MKYYMEVLVKEQGKQDEWQKVHPTGGSPYAYDTHKEALDMLRMCYPSALVGVEVRVTEAILKAKEERC